MVERFRLRVTSSALVVIALGSILHFAWEWSGRSRLVGLFAAMNESTWEHLKMAFWPALALAPIQRVIYGQLPGWPLATLLRVLVPPVLIVLLFYGYTPILGRNYLLLDIGIFVMAVILGEVLGHAMLNIPLKSWMRYGTIAAISLAAVAFSMLSFSPPQFFLFTDPKQD